MEMALQMPNNYVEVCDDEMMYVEGGLSVPVWMAAGLINLGFTLVIGGAFNFARVGLRNLAKELGTKAASCYFNTQFRKKLIAKGIAAGIASGIAGAAANCFTLLLWAVDPGTMIANNYNAHDSNPQNARCDF